MCYGAGQMLDSPDARDFDVVTTQSSTKFSARIIFWKILLLSKKIIV